MQLHLAVPNDLAGAVLGKTGINLKQVASTLGCKVQMPQSGDGSRPRRVIMIGNYNQCMVVQELVHGRLMAAWHEQGSKAKDQKGELSDAFQVVLFVRAEAAGVVIGKQGFVLNQIRNQSGARIYLLREQVKG